MYDFKVVLNVITSAPNSIKIRTAVVELNHADGQKNITSPICEQAGKVNSI